MRQVLIIHSQTEIKAWLLDEALDAADSHIRNGYPELLVDWELSTITAIVMNVAEEDVFHPDLFEVVDGVVRKKEVSTP